MVFDAVYGLFLYGLFYVFSVFPFVYMPLCGYINIYGFPGFYRLYMLIYDYMGFFPCWIMSSFAVCPSVRVRFGSAAVPDLIFASLA